jgi:hypothetical protein
MLSEGSRGGGGVFACDCDYTALQLDWVDGETLRISYPSSTVIVAKRESLFFRGRTIRVRYKALSS